MILEMNGISKSFGANLVLSSVDFSVEKGEIHALLGENGAGKSTLLNILAGVIPRDAGTIDFDSRRYPSPSITQMEKAGIAFVHQEINTVNDLTVFENIFLNRELSGPFGLLKKPEMIRRTRELFESLGVTIDPERPASELRTSEKQLLEISRALYADAKLIILDEPTTALASGEIDHLFGILRRLRDQGKTFIFISHKMPEIFAVADRYTVLRNGRLISTGRISGTDPRQITTDMVGQQYADRDVYKPRELGEVVLELRDFSGQGFSHVNLEVRKGEVVAFTGLAGSGASELMQTMFGALPSTGGEMLVNGKKVSGSIHAFMKNRIGMLPTNRKENSVIPDMTVLENISVAEHTLSRSKPMISRKTELGKYSGLRDSLGIRAESPDDGILSLSGGNQQKVFLARWLNTDAGILLFDNPTQGVDVGAKEEIYSLILGFAAGGRTVLINTLEIPEIRKVSDRCAVFYAGTLMKVFTHSEINVHDIMLYSTNAVNILEERENAE